MSEQDWRDIAWNQGFLAGAVPTDDAKGCEPVPCPSTYIECPPFEEVNLTVVAVCNCAEIENWDNRLAEWGNPWGRPDCPVHAEDVQRAIRDAAGIQG